MNLDAAVEIYIRQNEGRILLTPFQAALAHRLDIPDDALARALSIVLSRRIAGLHHLAEIRRFA